MLNPSLDPGLTANIDAVAHIEPLLVSISWLACLTTRSISSLERDHARGLLPKAVRLGGSRKWRRAEILEWVEAGCPTQEEWEKRNRN